MSETRDRWAGIHISANPVQDEAGVYRVGFMWGLGHGRGYNGQPERVKTIATVVVNATGEGTVLGYYPPEQPLPGFKQGDFEEKALQTAKAQLAGV